MTASEDHVSDDDLHAFVDGQLDQTRRLAVATHLAAHPERAAEVEEWRRQNEAILALYDRPAREAVPARLIPAELVRARRGRRIDLLRLAAAALVVFALGAGAGFFLRGAGPAPDERLIAEAVDAHRLFVVQKRHPVEVAAAEEAHLAAWLSNSLDRPLAMPDLGGAGLTLVGGRLLPSDTGAAAQVMYETGSGDRVTLYITPRAPEDPIASRWQTSGGVGALYWASAAITCTIVADLPRAEIERIAGAVFAGLDGAPDYLPG